VHSVDAEEIFGGKLRELLHARTDLALVVVVELLLHTVRFRVLLPADVIGFHRCIQGIYEVFQPRMDGGLLRLHPNFQKL